MEKAGVFHSGLWSGASRLRSLEMQVMDFSNLRGNPVQEAGVDVGDEFGDQDAHAVVSDGFLESALVVENGIVVNLVDGGFQYLVLVVSCLDQSRHVFRNVLCKVVPAAKAGILQSLNFVNMLDDEVDAYDPEEIDVETIHDEITVVLIHLSLLDDFLVVPYQFFDCSRHNVYLHDSKM